MGLRIEHTLIVQPRCPNHRMVEWIIPQLLWVMYHELWKACHSMFIGHRAMFFVLSPHLMPLIFELITCQATALIGSCKYVT